jgi:biotin carboxyl carrier protein
LSVGLKNESRNNDTLACKKVCVYKCPTQRQKYLASRHNYKTMYHATVNNSSKWDVEPDASGYTGKLNGENYQLDVVEENGRYHILYNNESYNVEVVEIKKAEKQMIIRVNNNLHTVQLKDRLDDLLKSLGMEGAGQAKVREIKAPMPGMVLNIMVEAGAVVAKDQALIILEAMKMENVIKSPIDGTVKRVGVNQGVAVEKNTILIEFE